MSITDLALKNCFAMLFAFSEGYAAMDFLFPVFLIDTENSDPKMLYFVTPQTLNLKFYKIKKLQ